MVTFYGLLHKVKIVLLPLNKWNSKRSCYFSISLHSAKTC